MGQAQSGGDALILALHILGGPTLCAEPVLLHSQA